MVGVVGIALAPLGPSERIGGRGTRRPETGVPPPFPDCMQVGPVAVEARHVRDLGLFVWTRPASLLFALGTTAVLAGMGYWIWRFGSSSHWNPAEFPVLGWLLVASLAYFVWARIVHPLARRRQRSRQRPARDFLTFRVEDDRLVVASARGQTSFPLSGFARVVEFRSIYAFVFEGPPRQLDALIMPAAGFSSEAQRQEFFGAIEKASPATKLVLRPRVQRS